jgi:4-hydroxythreonine-4-phosphate dehydrogenase
VTDKRIARILITPGEPAGIGPDITIQAAQQAWPVELVALADPDLLLARAKQLGLALKLTPLDVLQPATQHNPGELKIIPVQLDSVCEPGKLNRDNASYIVQCLTLAADFCFEKNADALVTGPIQKSLLNEAKIPFTGHTEFFAQHFQVAQTIMLFVAEQLKVALVTTHLPLAAVPDAITPAKLLSVIRLLHQELKKKFRLAQPKILVCGLNPHAGEMGYLGREEIDIIEPALKQLRAEHIDVEGPLPADTIFTEKYLKNCDTVLAMYHDQALPVVKYMSFGHAANVTLGLPIVRTSVDHGTALDVAGTGKADTGSLVAAIRTAMTLI